MLLSWFSSSLDWILHTASMFYGYWWCGLSNHATVFPNYSIDAAVPCGMADGVELTATIFTPLPLPLPATADAMVHTILIRTPYGRGLLTCICRLLAQLGYRVICQDTRGRWSSGGTYEASLLGSEASDGYDTVKWIQKRYPGTKLGLMGISYLGYVQWAAIRALLERDGTSEAITCMMPVACASDMHPTCFAATGGGYIPSLDFVSRWVLFTFAVGRTHAPSSVSEIMYAVYYSYVAMLQTSPVVDMVSREPLHVAMASMLAPLVAGADDQRDVACLPFDRTQRSDAYWQHRSHRDILCGQPQNTFPNCVLVTGWHDIFLAGTLQDYRMLRLVDPTVRLVIGPWHHLQTVHPAVFGDLFRLLLAQLHRNMPPPGEELKSETETVAPVRVFLEASVYSATTRRRRWLHWAVPSLLPSPGTWVDLAAWPPREVVSERWWLSPDHRLVETLGGTASTLSYVFDPTTAPTPSRGTDSFHYIDGGPFAVTPQVHERTDCLHWTSGSLVDGLVLAGHVSAVIHATCTNADSVDYVVRLCEVSPDNITIVLAEGIERVRCTRGEATQVQIDIGSIGRIVDPGQRLRLYLCSSAYPRWALNEETPKLSTHHHIRCGGEIDVSCLVLPVIQLPSSQ